MSKDEGMYKCKREASKRVTLSMYLCEMEICT